MYEWSCARITKTFSVWWGEELQGIKSEYFKTFIKVWEPQKPSANFKYNFGKVFETQIFISQLKLQHHDWEKEITFKDIKGENKLKNLF